MFTALILITGCSVFPDDNTSQGQPEIASRAIVTLVNPGFESGITGWTALAGDTIAATSTQSKTGTGAIKLVTTSYSAAQTVSGLTPNTSYTLSAWLKTSSKIGVKDFGGTTVESVTVTGGTYTKYSITFTTGASNTSAVIYAKGAGSNGNGLADDFTLESSTTVSPSPSASPVASPSASPVVSPSASPASITKITVPAANVSASTSDANVPANSVDGDFNTRWSGDGVGAYITFNLGASKTVSYVKLSFYNGASRTFTFDVQTSSDGNSFTTRLNNQVSALNANLQTFDFADVSATHVRIVGKGNSVNTWNSYTEVEVWGQGSPVTSPSPSPSPLPGSPSPSPSPSASPSPSPSPSPVVSPSPSPSSNPTGTTRNVATSSEWSAAVTASQPGDTIKITANISTALSMSAKNGQSGKPITVIAATRLGITLNSITLTNCSYITVEGFKFGPNTAGVLTKVVNSTNIRITRNSYDHKDISASQSTIVCTQASADIEISHNYFDNKNIGTVSGSYIKFQYDAPNITKRAWIHHNTFKNIVPMPDGATFRGDSDRETIVTGIASSQDIMTDHVIEYNYFEDCDGENEIITVKTSRNIVRYNTFKNCLGSISVRFGTLTEIYGNFMFGVGASATMTDPNHETGGIRLYGSYHKVYNNYLQGLSGTTWRVPVLLDGGDTSDSSGGDSHERLSYTEVTNNTIVDCAGGIGFGINYTLAPLNCKVSNNIIANTKGALFTVTKQSNCTFEGNIAYVSGSATMGSTFTDAQVWNTNPLLALANGLYRISSGSPAINYAKGSYSYVTTDMDGQARATTDTGADESSAASITKMPMTTSSTGPNS